MTMAGPRKIVLVDDEEVLAWSLSNRLARVRPSWEIHTANTGEAALARIQSGPTDLLVADVRMPGMSGIDLIVAARGEHPRLPVIVMTAFQTPDIQRISGAPYTGFLEKPFEFDRLLELVEEALKPQPVGFSGAISVSTLPDIVQLYVLSSTTGMLVVNHRSGEGRLWFDRGAVLHAITATARGDAAFYEIMTWSGGEFRMRVGAKAPERTIESSWQELLIESCRRIDEKQRREELGGDPAAPEPPTTRGWSQAPPPPDSDVDAFFDQFTVEDAFPANQQQTTTITEVIDMNIKDCLAKLNQLDGFIGSALVDSDSGMLLGTEGGGSILNLEIAAASNTEVVRAKRKAIHNLSLKDGIEDILITLGKQYHLIRPLRARPAIFFYIALDRSRANLAMARIALADVEKELTI